MERVEYDGEFALVVEYLAQHGPFWWVLCPAAATLCIHVPDEDEDPTSPDDHRSCSISPSCDFYELHALAHTSIRARSLAAYGTSTDERLRAADAGSNADAL